ncbi:MAG TPA: DinB family protein [Pyrinomonadaceae bacterium]|nr:DinB family protein [Pyrinomonadaceae bacterium]
MTEIERIMDQLNRAFVGEAWHGPAVIEILEGITAQQAAAHPLAGGHSIWELALHITAWTGAGSRRLQGDRAQLTDVENFPPVTDSGERAWEEARESIKLAYEELRGAILLLDDSQLDQPIIEGMSSIYVTLHGVIQHSLYHAGQIAILKKAFSEGQTK